jgi:hypothetical protein
VDSEDGFADEGVRPARVTKPRASRRWWADAGNDVLIGNLGDNILEGGSRERSAALAPTATTFCAAATAADNLIGNGGSDTLDGQLGPDNLTGGDGSGIDRVIYPRLSAVTVTIDDVANDGEARRGRQRAERQRQVEGSVAGDSLTGSDRRRRHPRRLGQRHGWLAAAGADPP